MRRSLLDILTLLNARQMSLEELTSSANLESSVVCMSLVAALTDVDMVIATDGKYQITQFGRDALTNLTRGNNLPAQRILVDNGLTSSFLDIKTLPAKSSQKKAWLGFEEEISPESLFA